MSTTAQGEARKFLESTSVRGIPRIVKAKSSVQCFFWFIGVLACTGLLIWQFTMLIKKYYAYPVTTLFIQATRTERPIFPDITVCNNNPLVYSEHLSLAYPDYVNKLMTANLSYEFIDQTFGAKYDISSSVYSSISRDLLNPLGYIRNFPIADSQIFDISDSLVLECKYFSWSLDEIIDCHLEIVAVWSSDYYRCFTMHVPDDYRDQVRIMSAIFYINDNAELKMSKFNLDYKNLYTTGVRVLISPSGAIPDFEWPLIIGPGMETTIRLDQTQVSHLPLPYTDCMTLNTFNLDNGRIMSNDTYTEDSCFQVCRQQDVIDHCECFTDYLMHTSEQLTMANYTVCGNLSLNSHESSVNLKGIDQLLCYEELLVPKDMCLEQCKVPCQEYQNGLSTSASPWPDISSQLSFYKTFIENVTRFGSTFDEYNMLAEQAKLKNGSAKQLARDLDADMLIKNNFLQLNVMFESQAFYEQKEVPAFPAETFGAQVGGVLSLWLGVTVMFLFEIAEFIINLLLSFYQGQKTSPVVPFKVNM